MSRVIQSPSDEPVPTIFRADFVNAVHEEVRAAIEASFAPTSWWKSVWRRLMHKGAWLWLRDR
jgi:hypothetical protein